MISSPTLIKGGSHTDVRGTIKFINEFDLNPAKRLYVIEHPSTEIVRAWQGHKRECKWFYVTEGIFKVILVKPDRWEKPSLNLPYSEFILEAQANEVLSIPSGFASGFQALMPKSKLLVFSDFTVEESIADDYRFDQKLWYKWQEYNTQFIVK